MNAKTHPTCWQLDILTSAIQKVIGVKGFDSIAVCPDTRKKINKEMGFSLNSRSPVYIWGMIPVRTHKDGFKL